MRDNRTSHAGAGERESQAQADLTLCGDRCGPARAERAGGRDRANDGHRVDARQDRFAEPGLQNAPPGDAGTTSRGMKVVQSSAVFQPKQVGGKGSRVDSYQSKTGRPPLWLI